MKNLKKLRAQMIKANQDVLDNDNLKYILGGGNYSGGGSSSSTSGKVCCVSTCVCTMACCRKPKWTL